MHLVTKLLWTWEEVGSLRVILKTFVCNRQAVFVHLWESAFSEEDVITCYCDRHGNSLCTAFHWLWSQKTTLCVPYPVSGWRGYIDSQCSLEFLHLHCEQEGCVGHLLHLLFDKLCLCRFLEVFGFGDLVYKAHDLAWLVASNETVFIKKRVRVKVTQKYSYT